jgi:hypothetical protein
MTRSRQRRPKWCFKLTMPAAFALFLQSKLKSLITNPGSKRWKACRRYNDCAIVDMAAERQVLAART